MPLQSTQHKSWSVSIRKRIENASDYSGCVCFVYFYAERCCRDSTSVFQFVRREDSPTVKTDRPIIGILAQTTRGHMETFGRTYIGASYVKYIESAGGRVVPIRYRLTCFQENNKMCGSSLREHQTMAVKERKASRKIFLRRYFYQISPYCSDVKLDLSFLLFLYILLCKLRFYGRNEMSFLELI